MPESTRVEDFLRRSAAAYGGKTAVIAGGRRLTYAELDSLSDRLAATLQAQGVERNDRVLIFMDNGWEAAVSIYAVLKAGAVFVPINPSTKAERLGFVMRNCRARAILTQARLQPVVSAAAINAPSLRFIIAAGAGQTTSDVTSFETCIATPASPEPHGGTDEDLAHLIYTSGSTGEPKGVMMTHRNVEAAASSITTYLGSRADDIVLSALPLAFGYGLYQLIMAVRIGATLVLEKSFAFPQAIFETMRTERATALPLVPTMTALILQMKDLQPGALPDLRYITSAAAPLPPDHIRRLRALFPNVRLYSMYGQTECMRGTYLPPEELEHRPESVGIAIPGTEAFIVDEQGKRVDPDTIGELVIRGPHVMQGYWEDEEATARALRPGRNASERELHTGDLFRADADGFLYFVSRKDDIIKTRGEKVAPKQVETVLHACPGVAEALVIGVDDPILGKAVHALVVRSDASLTEREIIRHCARHLEDFMVPKSVEFRVSLPRTDSGKTSRRLAAKSMEATS
ncbi:AMP-dependent synthetase [Pseudaminobacter arsenicus]|uniref:AMP-dependent synthetase n=1 Tax=Borborobacter arsenicus TaxID=1851146 RepID=A0A432V6F3_9HYPH|nr:class I adenylate-forming enzyme family protein [Pseudaminobacter arsenicus]RUM97752.1 AMP-dependent synthetase [Pseudaminobacter arsenicus]